MIITEKNKSYNETGREITERWGFVGCFKTGIGKKLVQTKTEIPCSVLTDLIVYFLLYRKMNKNEQKCIGLCVVVCNKGNNMKKEFEPSYISSLREEKSQNGNETSKQKNHRPSLTNQILFSVRENNEYQALAAAEEQIRIGLPRLVRDEVMEWKYYLVRMLTLLISVLKTEDDPSPYFEQKASSLMGYIDRCLTKEECEALLLDMIRTFCNIRETTGGEYSALVRRVMEQAAMDLTKPLTLHYFAEQMNVNSSYLSNLFRRQTGITLTEYITDKRIEHAATLLEFSRTPVKLVAKSVGIPDVQYFSRLFKRKMGMTPTQYREQRTQVRRAIELSI